MAKADSKPAAMPSVDDGAKLETKEDTTQNRIDFNDPHLSGSEAAALALGYAAGPQSDE